MIIILLGHCHQLSPTALTVLPCVRCLSFNSYIVPLHTHTHFNLFRAALRLFIVFKLCMCPLTTPPVPSPDRKKAQELLTNPQQAEEGQGEGQGEGQPLAWKAPRTGKIIRSIHAGQSVCMYTRLVQYIV